MSGSRSSSYDGSSAPATPDAETVLGRFSPATRAWFDQAFLAATPAQLGA